MPATESGDLCYRSKGFRRGVIHYRCDDYPDGTITDALTGRTIVFPPTSAKIGFRRDDK